jgi:hypothetical protein
MDFRHMQKNAVLELPVSKSSSKRSLDLGLGVLA